MKKTFVDSIAAADTVADLFVLSEKTMAQKRDGSNYLNVKLADKTGSIKGVVWDNAEQLSEAATSGDVVRIQGAANEYKGELQLVIKKMETCAPDTVDPADFIPVTSHSVDSMFDRH